MWRVSSDHPDYSRQRLAFIRHIQIVQSGGFGVVFFFVLFCFVLFCCFLGFFCFFFGFFFAFFDGFVAVFSEVLLMLFLFCSDLYSCEVQP